MMQDKFAGIKENVAYERLVKWNNRKLSIGMTGLPVGITGFDVTELLSVAPPITGL